MRKLGQTSLWVGRAERLLLNRERCDVGCDVTVQEVRDILAMARNQGNAALHTEDTGILTDGTCV